MLKSTNEIAVAETAEQSLDFQIETLSLEQLESVGGGAETVNYG